MSKANENSMPESRFAVVTRLIEERKAKMAAEQRPWSIDWIQRKELPKPHFSTSSRMLGSRSSEQEE